MIAYFYAKTVRREVKSLKKYRGVQKILNYFRDSHGIVDYNELSSFVSIFYEDPNRIDFNRYERIKKDREDLKPSGEKRHNSVHYKKFMKIKKSPAYRALYVSIDLLLAAFPIMIINMSVNTLNSMWYFTAIFLCFLSCVDPFLCLNFLE